MGVVDFLEALTSNEVKWWVVHKPDMEFVGYSEFMENANIDVILIQMLMCHKVTHKNLIDSSLPFRTKKAPFWICILLHWR